MNSSEIDLNLVVAEQEKTLRQLLGDGVSLQITSAAKPAFIHGEETLISQVLLALAERARLALPGGGDVAVAVEHIEVDETHARLQSGARCGKFVRLTISDNGTGLRPEELQRLLTEMPAHSLRRALPLPVILGMVTRQRGWIEAVSQDGCGSVFGIYLPGPGGQTAAEAGEAILLVDDEAPIRRMVRTVLERASYNVIEAETGVQALSVWETNKDRVKLLLTDMVMPEGVTGRDLAHQLRRVKPGLNVIYTSGYDLDAEATRDTQEGGIRFLQKPYDARRLLETVHLAMGEKTSTGKGNRAVTLAV